MENVNDGWELTFGEKTWIPAKQAFYEAFVLEEEECAIGWGYNVLGYVVFLTENLAKNYVHDSLNDRDANASTFIYVKPLGWKPVSEHFYAVLKNSLHGKIKIQKLEELTKGKNV